MVRRVASLVLSTLSFDVEATWRDVDGLDAISGESLEVLSWGVILCT